MVKYYFNRIMRDARELITYPLWLIEKPGGPDNHFYKRKRIIRLTKENGYKNFIETGTFYGQMINAVECYYDKVLSIELLPALFEINKKAFTNKKKIKIFQGDSAMKLGDMINEAGDNIIFWLDGHYSGPGTGMGESTSPILHELEMIASKKPAKYCILIDDYRLFNGTDGYPTAEIVFQKVRQICSNCEINIDKDCLVIVKK